jgi:hypothetical protein
VWHKFLSTARRRHVTDEKKLLLIFTFYEFLSVKNMFRPKKKSFKMFEVKPILTIYSIYDESENDAINNNDRTSGVSVK